MNQRLSVRRTLAEFPPPTPLDTPCRLWQGSLRNGGYGQRPDRSTIHRWVVEQIGEDQLGTPWDPALEVMHLCDHKLCYRYDHLALATHAVNMADLQAKRRTHIGERNHFAKLTAAQVETIRGDDRILRVIAAEYGVHLNTIWRIKKGTDVVIRIYDYVATRLHCCVIGIGCMTLPIVALGGAGGWLGWVVLT